MLPGAEAERADRATVEAFLAGDAGAGLSLRQLVDGPVRRRLIARGATPSEADDLIGDLWSDCIPASPSGEEVGLPNESPPGSKCLLERFNGKGSLTAWLSTIATNRLLDLKRHKQVETRMRESGDPALEPGGLSSKRTTDNAVETLLHRALALAFSRCEAEAALLLRLVHLHGLSQRELGSLWGCHESSISRTLTEARSQLREQTLKAVRERDPWLELKWDDFVELCESRELEFLD